jgi:hypothetical protein
MSTEKNNNQFREDEIVIMSHVDKRTGEVVTRPYPKVGGRLRLAHEENGNLSISTEIIRYEENVAVVRALATTKKGYFNGLGMASLERDQQIAPAILELAETRAIARSLRFAGYGVEYCSAEEVSHLEKRFLTWRTVVLSSRPAKAPFRITTTRAQRSRQKKAKTTRRTHRMPASRPSSLTT